MTMKPILTYFPTSWESVVAANLPPNYWAEMDDWLQPAYDHSTVYPRPEKIFEALNRTPPKKVRVVIVGQDPYHGPNQANGLAFSVNKGVRMPPSLRNIFKELSADLHIPIPEHGDLSAWADQGVLLLNQVLTVEHAKPASHNNMGWQTLTGAVLKHLANDPLPRVFVLWGSHAQKLSTLINSKNHLVLQAPHPSPLSAYRGFFGSRPFSATNEYLIRHDLPAISW